MKKSDIIILFDIDNTLFNTLRLKESELKIFEIYEEVKETLVELSTVAKLGILSQGQIAFQEKKLRETNIAQYFFEEHKHIVEYKIDVMKEVFERYHNKAKVYFIDDWIEMLRFAKKTDPSVVTIWMKRGEYAQVQEESNDFIPDAVVTNLRGVIPLIN